MANTSLVGGVPDDAFVSRAEQAAQLAEDAQTAAEAAQAAAEQALANTIAALAAQVLDDHADVSSAGAANGEILKFNGANWINALLGINELTDVDTAGITNNQVLSWDGAQFVAADVAAISGALPIAGGTMTGDLILNGDPTLALEAATKAYVDAAFNGDSPYDFGIFFEGVPGNLEDVISIVAVRNFYLRQNLPISQAYARVAATAQTDFDIQKNGVSIGTIRWAAAATTATFIFAADVAFVPGDRLQVIAASVADATLEDISITLAGILGTLA